MHERFAVRTWSLSVDGDELNAIRFATSPLTLAEIVELLASGFACRLSWLATSCIRLFRMSFRKTEKKTSKH